MKAKPSDFAKPGSGSLRQLLKLPSFKVTAKRAPTATTDPEDEVSYGIDSLDKLVDAFDERQRALKKKA